MALTFVKSLYLLALVVWVGAIIFFSFVGAPQIFYNLTPVDAGRIVGAIFPIYYGIGYVCSAIMLLAAVVLRSDARRALDWTVIAVLSAIMLALTLYAGLAIQPRAAALRPRLHSEATATAVKPEFDHLHSLAVELNGAVLLAGLIAAVLTARRIEP